MIEAAEREAVIAEALTWLGTAYHHAAWIKIRRDETGQVIDRGGADCATSTYLIYRVALPNRIPDLDLSDYSPQWNLRTQAAQAERYLMTVCSVPGAHETKAPKPGDLVLYRFAHAWAHGAIIMSPGWPAILHANGGAGRVMLDQGRNDRLAKAPIKFFSLW